MIPNIIGLIIGIVSFVIFFCVWYFVVLPSKRKRMTEEAEQEAEIIKQKKLLEVILLSSYRLQEVILITL